MKVLIDTGPLISYFNRRDPWHRWVSQKMGTITDTLITCEAVLSESCFLLQREELSPAPIFKMIQQQVLDVKPLMDTIPAQKRIAEIIDTYDNLPVSFADACLVRMAETTRNARVFTLDTDFTIYRMSKGKPLSLISPF